MYMTKKSFIVLFLILSIAVLWYPPKTEAAKKFVRKTVVNSKVSYSSVPAKVLYRSDHQGLYLSFLNFNGIESVSYSFTYSTNGNPQGAGGTITSTNNPTMQRELLFGTCSTSVCTYHRNLTNAKLVLTAKYTNGRTVNKSYRIKTYQ